MTVKRVNQIILSGCFLMSVFGMTSCSSDDNHMVDEGVKFSAGNITFALYEEPFNANVELNTRSSKAPKVETVDMGDDFEAEVTTEPDTTAKPMEAATRAVANGHYTIWAYDGSNRVGGELRGTISGGNFTRDSDSQPFLMIDANKTYTLVCFNDKITASGDELLIKREDVKDALIATQQFTPQGKRQEVQFHLKHPGVRVRIKLEARMEIKAGIKTTLADNHADVASQTLFNAGSNTYNDTKAVCSHADTYPASTPWDWSNYNTMPQMSRAIESNQYHYFLPTTTGTNLKLVFTEGNLYNKEFANQSVVLNSLGTMTANASYVIKFKFKPKYKYLFSDGSWGENDGSKTAIGIVVKEKTATEQGIAMALKDTPSGWGFGFPNSIAYPFEKYQDAIQDMRGEYWTWDPHGSKDNATIKATAAPSAFYRAANYKPGVETSNIGRWYLPSLGEWLLAAKMLGYYEIVLSHWNGYSLSEHWYHQLVKEALNAVGGDTFYSNYWSSTDGDAAAWYINNIIYNSNFGFGQGVKGSGYSVRAFVHF